MARKTAAPEVELHPLNLTVDELIHLRDLFGVLLPPDASVTVSESLALLKQRAMVEGKLWDKIEKLCVTANVAIGDEAEDFGITFSAPPSLGVFPIVISDQGPGEEDEEESDELDDEDEESEYDDRV